MSYKFSDAHFSHLDVKSRFSTITSISIFPHFVWIQEYTNQKISVFWLSYARFSLKTWLSYFMYSKINESIEWLSFKTFPQRILTSCLRLTFYLNILYCFSKSWQKKPARLLAVKHNTLFLYDRSFQICFQVEKFFVEVAYSFAY